MKRVAPLSVLLIAALCCVLSACGSSSSSTTTGGSKANNAVSDSNVEKTSLNDLLKGNKNVKCTFSTNIDAATNTTSTGTVYITGKRMRGEFAERGENSSEASNIIRDNDYSYFWQDGSKSGYKMKLSDLDTTTTTAKQNTTTTAADATTTTEPDFAEHDDDKYDYNCTQWTVDESLLTPPSDVNFVDYAEQIKQAQQQASAAAAQICQQLPEGDTRTACLSHLSQ